MRSSSLADEIDAALESGSGGLTRAALLVSRVESPRVALAPAMAAIDALGAQAEARVSRAGSSRRERIAAINALLYDEAGFRGNRDHYDDVRNSLLTLVLERRLGIPVSLAVIYMAVARRAGLDVHGVSFPGHFLLRVDGDDEDGNAAIILDPFDGGRELDAADQRALLARHAGDEAALDARVLEPCANRAIVVRMLNNLKRLYVGARSFPQAWQVTDLLVALDDGQPEDVRDRGLLAYHLDDFPAALRDLESYLGTPGPAHEDTAERRQIWEHVSALRRRVAGLN
ncbi:MAG TPA: transglutaminase-like domain-containing protein [Vicinamibacterales bacterium]|jgi:regulator of sirC expression with transglutaminase-like and TPR domain|nr:transglutaminase-like domain-containing protein [Vicinamibacterales bacterium]